MEKKKLFLKKKIVSVLSRNEQISLIGGLNPSDRQTECGSCPPTDPWTLTGGPIVTVVEDKCAPSAHGPGGVCDQEQN